MTGPVDPTKLPLGSMALETFRLERHIKVFLARLNSVQGAKALLTIKRELLTRIIMKTPVKTGRARAGWFAAAEAIDLLVPVEGGDPQAVGKGKSEGRVKLVLTGPNKRIISINRVPYIQRLEFGSSSQAPQGMVRVSMREVRGRLPKELSKELFWLWRLAVV